MTDSFEYLVATLPDAILVTDGDLDEMVALAQAADQEAENARSGGASHELGATIAQFVVRLAEVCGTGDVAVVERIVGQMRAMLDAAEADDVTSRFRRT